MTFKSTVETITHTAVNTAVAAVRDPRGTATKATGLVLNTAGTGLSLVRSRIGGAAEQAPAPVKDAVKDAVKDVAAKVEEAAPDEVVEKVEETAAKVEEAVPATKPAAKKTPAAKKAPTETKPAAKKPAAEKPDATEDPRDHIPGPDLVAFAPPAPEDLPEPIVIEAE